MRNLFAKVSRLDPAWKTALGVYIPLRLVLSGLAALVIALSSAPVAPDPVLRPYQGVEPIVGGWEGILLAPWQRFDTLWYLKIATGGYAADDGSLVFFPLYPLLIRLLGGLLLGNYLLAAILISNLAYLGAIYLMYKMSSREVEEIRNKTCLYLSLFPAGFFLLAGYTESLFLFFTLLAFHAAQKERWLLAEVAGLLASLTRLQGVVLILPLAYLAWRNKPHPRTLLSLLLIPLGATLFLAYGYFFFGNTIFTTYQTRLYAQFVLPSENIAGGVSLLLNGDGSLIDFLNLMITLLFLAMTVLAFLRMPREYGVYMAATLFTLLLRRTTLQPLVSMSRYGLSLFPAFMLWGEWGQNKTVHRLILYPSIALYLYLAGQFFLWGWVA